LLLNKKLNDKYTYDSQENQGEDTGKNGNHNDFLLKTKIFESLLYIAAHLDSFLSISIRCHTHYFTKCSAKVGVMVKSYLL